MNYICKYDSPIGEIMLASDGDNIIGLWLKDQKYFADILLNEQCEEKRLPIFKIATDWLDIYFSGEKPSFMPSLKLVGSEFRLSVWKILSNIPYGKTVSYGDIARKISVDMGEVMSAQAVGGAVGHNPISIMIPCHRVVGKNGSLTGFASGIDNKIQLLKLEKVQMNNLFIPTK